MGQVYQATDTKLNREVALKILPEAFATDPDRLARFQREAQVLASLNHPGIAAIYGIEESEDTRALVLELVEGPTLADRISKGPIPLDEALPIAKQIAEALEAAHEAGVIHRDLKPANIKVREDGTVKVLDFGLAKALDPNPTGDPSQSPTLTAAATQMGVIMGTAAYMSPEQARGKPVDKRADIWSFGVVLYEMLTGHRAFQGEDVSLTLASVMRSDVNVAALPHDLPDNVRTVLRRCLEKDASQRIRDIGDVRLAMEGAFETTVRAPSDTVVMAQAKVWQRPAPAPLAAVLLTVVGGLAGRALTNRTTGPPPLVARFTISLPEGVSFGPAARHLVALSPDGTRLAYRTSSFQTFLRRMDQIDAVPVRGLQGLRAGVEPFFSPDGLSLGFWADGQIRTVSLAGGDPVPLGAALAPSGATWGSDDVILFGQGNGGVWRVPATGGTPEVVIEMVGNEAALSPQMLPGGEWVLFTAGPLSRAEGEARIVVQSTATGQRHVLIEGGRDARYISTGHLVYELGGAIVAVGFDPETLAVTTNPVSLVEDVAISAFGPAHFSVSTTGSLVYLPDSIAGDQRQLMWADRAGREEPLDIEPAAFANLDLSPDGMRAALGVSGVGSGDVWVADLARGTRQRLTTSPGFDTAPLWSLDGQRVVFASNRNGHMELFSKLADGTGAAESIAAFEESATRVSASDWSPDGSVLLVQVRSDDADFDIAVVKLGEAGVWEPLIATEADERTPMISPNGRWVAYVSDESSRREVYVQRFPGGGDRTQVSVGSGVEPRWSASGNEITYLRAVLPSSSVGEESLSSSYQDTYS